MTSRIELQIAALGRVDEAVAARVAAAARPSAGTVASRPRGRFRRHVVTLGRPAVGTALALAVVAALLLSPHPWDGEPASAALLRRVAIAVTPPPHTIQHIVMVLHQGSHAVTTESWQSTDDPFTYRWRQTSSTSCGGTYRAEYSSTPSERQWFDADHERVLRMPLDPARERASVPAGGARAQFDATVSFALALHFGAAHVAGSTMLDGKPVTQITWPSSDPNDPASRNILYVEAATGVPVAYEWGGGKLDSTGGIVARQTYPTYEFLPETPAASRELSEHGAHPAAPLAPMMTERQLSSRAQEAQRLHCGGVG